MDDRLANIKDIAGMLGQDCRYPRSDTGLILPRQGYEQYLVHAAGLLVNPAPFYLFPATAGMCSLISKPNGIDIYRSGPRKGTIARGSGLYWPAHNNKITLPV
jgi:hypothetical protein